MRRDSTRTEPLGGDKRYNELGMYYITGCQQWQGHSICDVITKQHTSRAAERIAGVQYTWIRVISKQNLRSKIIFLGVWGPTTFFILGPGISTALHTRFVFGKTLIFLVVFVIFFITIFKQLIEPVSYYSKIYSKQ